MATTQTIADLPLERLQELKRSEVPRLFIYPENLKRKDFIEATGSCLVHGDFIACTTKTMPTKKSHWKSEKGRHLKFLLPEGEDLSEVLKQFDAGKLEVVVLQTPQQFVAIPPTKFLEDIVPVNHILVNGSVEELIQILNEVYEAPQDQSDDDEMEDVVTGPLPKELPPTRSQLPSSTEKKDKEPQTERDEDEEDGAAPTPPADQPPGEEDDDDVEEVPRQTEPPKQPNSSAWIAQVSFTENDKGHRTADYVATGDEHGEAMRVINEGGCGEGDPENCKFCSSKPEKPFWKDDEQEEEAPPKKKKPRKNTGGKNRKGTISLEACKASVDKLIAERKKKGRRFPYQTECAKQATFDGVEASEATIRRKIASYHSELLSKAENNGELDDEGYFIVD